MLGVSRLAGDPDGIEAEFAVLVGDPWQDRGIGAALMESCLAIAKERGFRLGDRLGGKHPNAGPGEKTGL